MLLARLACFRHKESNARTRLRAKQADGPTKIRRMQERSVVYHPSGRRPPDSENGKHSAQLAQRVRREKTRGLAGRCCGKARGETARSARKQSPSACGPAPCRQDAAHGERPAVVGEVAGLLRDDVPPHSGRGNLSYTGWA